MRRFVLKALLSGVIATGVLTPAHAQDGDSMAGRTYAVQHCAECHDVAAGPRRAIRRLDAPDFKAIADASTTTPMGLQVFLTTTHAKMPNFMIPEEDRRNVITYILSLAHKAKPSTL